jgi:hypothetical protein
MNCIKNIKCFFVLYLGVRLAVITSVDTVAECCLQGPSACSRLVNGPGHAHVSTESSKTTVIQPSRPATVFLLVSKTTAGILPGVVLLTTPLVRHWRIWTVEFGGLSHGVWDTEVHEWARGANLRSPNLGSGGRSPPEGEAFM